MFVFQITKKTVTTQTVQRCGVVSRESTAWLPRCWKPNAFQSIDVDYMLPPPHPPCSCRHCCCSLGLHLAGPPQTSRSTILGTHRNCNRKFADTNGEIRQWFWIHHPHQPPSLISHAGTNVLKSRSRRCPSDLSFVASRPHTPHEGSCKKHDKNVTGVWARTMEKTTKCPLLRQGNASCFRKSSLYLD